MSNIMAVLLNGIAQLEYDRDKPLPDHQGAYLEKMDRKMDSGIMVGDTNIPNPDQNQRSQFVAANLANALINNENTVALALCTYLANRLVDLKQVKISDQNGNISIEFVFDEDYKKQIPVQLLH